MIKFAVALWARWADHSLNSRLNDSARAVCAGKTVHHDAATFDRGANPCGVVDRVAFGMFEPVEFFSARPVKSAVVGGGDSTRKAIIAQRADLVCRAKDHRADVKIAVLGPTGNIVGKRSAQIRGFPESDIPSTLRTHRPS
jgi:hypothetical protein